MKPYIGISCITSVVEAEFVAKIFLQNGFSKKANYQGAIGYAITWKILRKKHSTNTRYVSVENLFSTMSQNTDFGMNVVHFVPEPNTHSQFIDDMKALFLQTGIYNNAICRNLQLNYASSISSDALKEVKHIFPDLKIIFQIGYEEIYTKHADNFIKNLQSYAPCIDAVLIDPSQGTGTGIELDTVHISSLLKKLQMQFSKLQIGFAGGLKVSNLEKNLKKFSQLTNNFFSFDIESGVRSAEDDTLNLISVDEFIKSAKHILLEAL